MLLSRTMRFDLTMELAYKMTVVYNMPVQYCSCRTWVLMLRVKTRDIMVLHRRDSARIWYSTVKVSLRPYQESCIQACLHSLQPGTDRVTRVGVSLPTGS